MGLGAAARPGAAQGPHGEGGATPRARCRETGGTTGIGGARLAGGSFLVVREGENVPSWVSAELVADEIGRNDSMPSEISFVKLPPSSEDAAKCPSSSREEFV